MSIVDVWKILSLRNPGRSEGGRGELGTNPLGQISVADPGFPEEGAPTPGGRQHTILPNFLKNCMKLKEFGPLGGEHPSVPLKIRHWISFIFM